MRAPEHLDAFFGELAAWADEADETLRYGDHEDQVIDLRRADGPGAELPKSDAPGGADMHHRLSSCRRPPVALVLHGGFWRPGFTRRNTDALATALAQAGWTTANVEYRRLGPGAYRELLDDVAAAAQLVRPAVAIGHSAGGHLALWLGARGDAPAAVALGGVCDLRAAAAAGLGNDAVREFLGTDPAEVPEADPAQQLPLGVPQLLVHGTEDDRVPIEHARAYAELAGDECRVLELDGADHFDVIDPRSAGWGAIPTAMRGLTP